MRLGDATIRAVLFDKDGTLLDFQGTWAPLAVRLIDELSDGDDRLGDALATSAGFDRARARYLPESPLAGGDGSEMMARWLTLLPSHDEASLKTLVLTRAASVIQGGLVPASADLAGLLAMLADAGAALGVATHDRAISARAQMQALGVADVFAFYAGVDSGYPRKPDPAVFHAFCDVAGCAPGEAVMVGDSEIDLELARASGAAGAIGVLTGPAPREALAPYADLLLDSIDDLPEALGLRSHA